MENTDLPDSDAHQPGKRTNQLDYRRPTPRPPRLEPDAAKFEREGWIGLIVTLVICTAAFVLWMIFHKGTDSF